MQKVPRDFVEEINIRGFMCLKENQNIKDGYKTYK